MLRKIFYELVAIKKELQAIRSSLESNRENSEWAERVVDEYLANSEKDNCL